MAMLGTNVFTGNAATKVTAQLARYDIQFLFAKATEGLTFNDSRHDAIRNETLNAGKWFGSFHFGWPNQDAHAEFDHFLQRAQPSAGHGVVLDLENWDSKNNYTAMQGCSWRDRFLYGQTWSQDCLEALGIRPLTYLNWDWIKNLRSAATVDEWEWFIDNPLWIAQWNGKPGVFDYAAPKSGSTKEWHPAIHQYASGSSPSPTVPTTSGLDENWVFSYTDLRKIALPTEEDGMSAAQFEDIMAGIGSIQNDLESQAITLGELKTGQAKIAKDVSDQFAVTNTTLKTMADDIDGLGEEVSIASTLAVKESLTGFEVNTSMKFPQ